MYRYLQACRPGLCRACRAPEDLAFYNAGGHAQRATKPNHCNSEGLGYYEWRRSVKDAIFTPASEAGPVAMTETFVLTWFGRGMPSKKCQRNHWKYNEAHLSNPPKGPKPLAGVHIAKMVENSDPAQRIHYVYRVDFLPAYNPHNTLCNFQCFCHQTPAHDNINIDI